MRTAVCEDALGLVRFEHDPAAELDGHAAQLREIARHLSLDMTLTDVKAFGAVVHRRAARATRVRTSPQLLNDLRAVGFPPELWDAQVTALDAGLLDPAFDAWGLAAPTGTGKTFLARLLALDSLRRHPGSKILYIVPTKALVHQVSRDLERSLEPAGIDVTAVTPQPSRTPTRQNHHHRRLKGADCRAWPTGAI